MTIKDIIKITATIIGREDVVEYLENKTATPSQEVINTVDVMKRLANLVINELACSFIPMKKLETQAVKDGKVFYKDLSFNPLVILNAYDVNGNKLSMIVKNTHIQIDSDRAQIEYTYFPPDYTIDQVIGFQEKDVSARVLAYGLAAEYAITQGCFKDAVMWHKRYADCVYLATSPKNSTIKERLWV